MEAKEEGSALTFPCQFPIKVIGNANEDFEATVVAIIRRHAPNVGESAFQLRPSDGGKYLAITVTITANNQQQLDAIYEDLTQSKLVLMAL